jgi:hypothetical protein
MKYLEELNIGDSFSYQNQVFLLTSDFKANGNKLCYSLNTGFPTWLSSQSIVEHSPIYILDKDNNIIPLNITPKNDIISN